MLRKRTGQIRGRFTHQFTTLGLVGSSPAVSSILQGRDSLVDNLRVRINYNDPPIELLDKVSCIHHADSTVSDLAPTLGTAIDPVLSRPSVRVAPNPVLAYRKFGADRVIRRGFTAIQGFY